MWWGSTSPLQRLDGHSRKHRSGNCADAKGCRTLIIGDLNVDLDFPRDNRDEAVAEAIDTHDVMCFTGHFGQRRRRLIRGSSTWQQKRGHRWIRSKAHYFLGQESTRAKIRGCISMLPRHYELDHRAVVTRLRRSSDQKLW